MINELSTLLLHAAQSAPVILVIKSILVIAIGLIVSYSLGRIAAAVRHLILLATFGTLILLPVVALFAPELEIVALPPESELISTPGNRLSSQHQGNEFAVEERLANPVVNSQLDPATTWRVIYATGALAVLLYLLLGISRVHRITRVAANGCARLSRDNCSRAVAKRKYSIYLSDEITSPMTWGAMRPVVLLPGSAEQWPKEALANALQHEAAHIRRYDWLVQVFARCICAVYWFNPLVWIAYRQLLLEAERAADDAVVGGGADPNTYASQLIEFARQSLGAQSLPFTATPMAERRSLHLRIHSILKSGEGKMEISKPAKTILVIFVAVTASLVGSASLVAAPSDGAHSNTTTPLIFAAYKGNVSEVRQIVSAGADVNVIVPRKDEASPYQRTAINTAAARGHLQVVDILLSSGAQQNRIVKGDATPLIEAIRNRHDDVASMLIDRGADVSISVPGDGSPLIAAAATGNTAMAKILIDRGADVNQEVARDDSPLYHAIVTKNTELLQVLIDAGADVHRAIPGDGNALMVAIEHHNNDAAKLLIEAGALE